MSDNLISGSDSDKGGDQTSADEKATKKSDQNPKKHIDPPHPNEIADTKPSYGLVVILFLVVEAAAFILWQIADSVTGYFSTIFHWLSLVCISVGPMPVILKAVKWKWLIPIGVLYVLVWFILGCAAVIVWFPAGPGPSPRFKVSMQIGDSPRETIMLTNEYLHTNTLVTVITNFPDGVSIVGGVPAAWLAIPVLKGESNVVFTFFAQNDSPFRISNLEFRIGFPADWKVSMDNTKWTRIGANLVAPGHEFELTNFQFWVSKIQTEIYQADKAWFDGITNLDAPVYKDPSTRIESIRLTIRTGGYEDTLMANVSFFEVPSNVYKPFLLTGRVDPKDHRFHTFVSDSEAMKQIIDSQK